ncbi:CRB_1a_G0054860.mRNA.1.CDS.1 [Saccharomyces cerevisiae]|nr:CRB_1a_G0054860.mRNA.1.CDS.1 [Saccharomyces cerevisiae]CAI7480359.1 CRB_1a_G0054860.mRNA.1.CDS.1 [Saccharomyces cerevisiae]
MVFNENEVPLLDLDKWVNSNGKLQFQNAIKSMKSLHLLIPNKSSGTLMINLNPTFKISLRNALTGGEVQNSFGVVVEENVVSLDLLDEYSANKWETILHFMVGTPLAKIPSEKVLNLLKHSKLMEEVNSTGEFKITNEGFQFLLQEINSQLWTLLLQYLKNDRNVQNGFSRCLHFIFMLGALEVGKAYKIDALSETQRIIFDADFRYQDNQICLNAMDSVLRQNREEPSVNEDGANGKSTTDITTSDDLNKAGLKNQDIPDGSLIVETNFKIYSYSNSPLQIAVLSLFVHLKARFVNMVLGQITRESIRRALTNGITADQIIAYLETHAHPQMRRLAEEKLEKKLELDPNCKEPLQVLPPTVVDQIRLWQLELDRVITYEGSLYSDFETSQEYNLLSKYAQDIGVLLWKDDKKKKFFHLKGR